MRCPKGIDYPMIAVMVRDESANADDRTVDVLREFVAHRDADFLGGFAHEIVSGGKAADIGYRLNVPDKNGWHVMRLACRRVAESH